MKKPYTMPAIIAKPDIKVPPPKACRWILFMVKYFGRLFYLAPMQGVRFARIIFKENAGFFDVFKRALEGKSHCILAFRHPHGEEPQLLTWYVLRKLRKQAAKAGYHFARHPHSIFVYGYEVLRWGGFMARFVMPRLGSLPIHHVKINRQSMDWIYRTIIEGNYPLAIAPEGQVSYTAEGVPRLEQGTIRIGFGVAERLGVQAAPVEIVPISVHFRYNEKARRAVQKLLAETERLIGLSVEKTSPFSERVRLCREGILRANEKRYGIEQTDREYSERMDALLDAAMTQAELILGLPAKTIEALRVDFFTRLYGLRQHCWDRIYLPGQFDLAGRPALERSIADLAAGEAWHAGRHLELADFGWYFRGAIPAENAPLHILVEYVQNLSDFANRTRGGTFVSRQNIPPCRIVFCAAPIINLSERLPEYREDKKAAVERALHDLETRYRDCIKEMESRNDY
ncbi:acyltransferase [Breznakiellaceae bacterium SP9]